MSQLQLVFLHIPKTAGTSFRQKLNHSYGRDNVFWIGVDCDSSTREYPVDLVGDRPVSGGHRGISFYPADLSPIYCSVLRDPVERAVSLFAYYTRPDLARTDGQKLEREKQLTRMLDAGIDPASLSGSLEQCPPFRAAISNQQCRFLSRGNPDFSGAVDTLGKHDFLLGTVSQYARFYQSMVSMLGWKESAAASLNSGKENYADEYLSEVDAVTRIRQLNLEDQKLVDYVEQQHGGLYSNLPASDTDARLARLASYR